MKINKNSFSKLLFCIFFFALSVHAVSQSGRGAVSCPDFSSSSPKKNKYVFKTLNFFRTKVFSKEGTIKITPYTSVGIGSEYINSEKSSTNGVVTANNLDTTGWESHNFNRGVIGVLVDYEIAFKKKSTLQFSLGYEAVEYAESYQDLPPTTNSTGTSAVTNSGMYSNNFMAMVQYRHYFLYSLRRFYVSSLLKIKEGNTTYQDLSESHDKNDFDFKEHSTEATLGALVGYQWLIHRKFVLDFFVGPVVNYTVVYGRNFLYPNVSEATFENTHSTDKLASIYDKTGLGLKWGISFGYKFGKKK
jgi:hypothetical protein